MPNVMQRGTDGHGIISRIKWLRIVILLNIPLPLLAAEPEVAETIAITSEPTKCYEAVWGSNQKNKDGMGLNAGQPLSRSNDSYT